MEKKKQRRYKSPDGNKRKVNMSLSITCVAMLNALKARTNIAKGQLVQLAVHEYFSVLMKSEDMAKVIDDMIAFDIQETERVRKKAKIKPRKRKPRRKRRRPLTPLRRQKRRARRKPRVYIQKKPKAMTKREMMYAELERKAREAGEDV